MLKLPFFHQEYEDYLQKEDYKEMNDRRKKISKKMKSKWKNLK